jgi:hypothetical protein
MEELLSSCFLCCVNTCLDSTWVNVVNQIDWENCGKLDQGQFRIPEEDVYLLLEAATKQHS